jgi:hypothetical protein
MKNTMEDLLQTIEENAVDNALTIADVKLFVKSWREEAEIFGQNGCPCCKIKEVVTEGYCNVCGAKVGE